MARKFTEQQRSVLELPSISFCTLWEMQRKDGVVLRFTDHDTIIEFENNNFSPVGGFNASARQNSSEFDSPANLEIIGMLSDESITDDDLKAGRYDGALIIERLVNHKHPFLGAFKENHFFITDSKHSEEHWEVKVEGLGRFMSQKIGNMYTHECRHELGDSICLVDLAATQETGTVFLADADPTFVRSRFEATGLTAGSQFFALGRFEWLTGLNVGIFNNVKNYVLGALQIVELQEPTPFVIAPNDTFSIQVGCDKLRSTCISKFNNIDNYGGFPFIPGNDKTLQVPKRSSF